MKIDKNIPAPKVMSQSGARKYPFPDMEIGHSFWVESDRPVRQAISAWHKRNKQRFTCRKVSDGYRVWRVA